MINSSSDSPPNISDEFGSRGSSVSSWMQEEYDKMIRYATVTPCVQQEMVEINKDIGRLFQSLPFIAPNTTTSQCVEVASGQGDILKGQGDFVEIQHESHQGKGDSTLTPADISSSRVPDPAIQDLLPDLNISVIDSTPGHFPTSDNRPKPHIDLLPSLSSTDVSDEWDIVHSMNIDPDISKMEAVLDKCTDHLKHSVLTQFGQSKFRILDLGKKYIQKNKDRLDKERLTLQNDIEDMKEMMHRYEQTVKRQETIITNLTLALQRQKDKQEMTKAFADWRIHHSNARREVFCTKLAQRHHERRILRRSWCAWHSILETKWQTRVERACQARATEVCTSLTCDYETRIASLNEALDASVTEVEKLKKERERYEEMMKKAFMRGVCALNMEAMSMFQGNDFQKDEEQIKEYQNGLEAISRTVGDNSSHAAPASSVTRHKAAPLSVKSVDHLKPTHNTGRKPHILTTKLSAKVDTGFGHSGSIKKDLSHHPPRSVIIERHNLPHKEKGPATQCVQSILAQQDVNKKSGRIHQSNASQAPLVMSHNIRPVKSSSN